MESEKLGFTNKMSEIWRKMQVKNSNISIQYILFLGYKATFASWHLWKSEMAEEFVVPSLI